MITEIDLDPAKGVLPTDPDAAVTLRHDAAARLLAWAGVSGRLTANVPPWAWSEEFPELCLTVAARAQPQHENDDLDKGDQP